MQLGEVIAAPGRIGTPGLLRVLEHRLPLADEGLGRGRVLQSDHEPVADEALDPVAGDLRLREDRLPQGPGLSGLRLHDPGRQGVQERVLGFVGRALHFAVARVDVVGDALHERSDRFLPVADPGGALVGVAGLIERRHPGVGRLHVAGVELSPAHASRTVGGYRELCPGGDLSGQRAVHEALEVRRDRGEGRLRPGLVAAVASDFARDPEAGDVDREMLQAHEVRAKGYAMLGRGGEQLCDRRVVDVHRKAGDRHAQERLDRLLGPQARQGIGAEGVPGPVGAALG